jgi:hypothetical protein
MTHLRRCIVADGKSDSSKGGRKRAGSSGKGSARAASAQSTARSSGQSAGKARKGGAAKRSAGTGAARKRGAESGKGGARAASAQSTTRSSAQSAGKERKGGSSQRGSTGERSSSSNNGAMSTLDVVSRAREQLQALLGRPVEAVLGIDRDRGSWIVTAQVVELSRIPNTTDVLGEYEAVLDRRGDVASYRRTHRYHRGQTDGGQK